MILLGDRARSGHIKFETFAGQWFKEYVEKALGKRTQANYRQLAPRIYQDIGHLYMDKITPRLCFAVMPGVGVHVLDFMICLPSGVYPQEARSRYASIH